MVDEKSLFEERGPWSHKGDFGKVLVIGGSEKYHGSPIFAGMAAYRVGADLVTIVAPQRAADAAAHFAPDLITVPLNGPFLTLAHVPQVILEIKEADAVVIGGGLGRRKETFKAIEQLLRKITQPIVVDADALRALGSRVRGTQGKYEIIKKMFGSSQVILTPHFGELMDLLDRKDRADFKNLELRKKFTQELAQKLACVVLFKGQVDVIADPEKIKTNQTGSPYMTVGGTGDLLAGVCGALLARMAAQGEVDAFEAACRAAWLNGRAGELAAAVYGESLLASDILNFYHLALSSYPHKRTKSQNGGETWTTQGRRK